MWYDLLLCNLTHGSNTHLVLNLTQCALENCAGASLNCESYPFLNLLKEQYTRGGVIEFRHLCRWVYILFIANRFYFPISNLQCLSNDL